MKTMTPKKMILTKETVRNLKIKTNVKTGEPNATLAPASFNKIKWTVPGTTC